MYAVDDRRHRRVGPDPIVRHAGTARDWDESLLSEHRTHMSRVTEDTLPAGRMTGRVVIADDQSLIGTGSRLLIDAGGREANRHVERFERYQAAWFSNAVRGAARGVMTPAWRRSGRRVGRGVGVKS